MKTTREVPQLFVEWRSDWTVTTPFRPVDYLNQPTGIRDTLMAQWLYSPTLIEYRDGVYLADNFLAKFDDDWLDKAGHHVATVEEVTNRVNLWDIFDQVDLAGFDRYLQDLAETLRKCWTGTLLAAFPDRHFTVVTASEEEGSYGPSVTFYSAPAADSEGPTSHHALPDEPR